MPICWSFFGKITSPNQSLTKQNLIMWTATNVIWGQLDIKTLWQNFLIVSNNCSIVLFTWSRAKVLGGLKMVSSIHYKHKHKSFARYVSVKKMKKIINRIFILRPINEYHHPYKNTNVTLRISHIGRFRVKVLILWPFEMNLLAG